jgi:AcrR family transcriptional regulator
MLNLCFGQGNFVVGGAWSAAWNPPGGSDRMDAMTEVTEEQAAASPAPRGKRSATGRERILQAAAELFAAQGYAATSTRDIAQRAGIRQPSLYAHFALKSDILCELLVETLRPPIEYAAKLRDDPDLTARDRLIQFLDFDIRGLFAGRRTVAVLGALPEVRGDEFAEAHRLRRGLRELYGRLIGDVLNQAGKPSGEDELRRTTAITFTLVEGITLRRYEEPELDADLTIRDTTAAILRILDV